MAEKFYQQALDWQFRDSGSPDFAIVTNAGVDGGLLATKEKTDRGSSIKNKKAGGKVEIEPTPIGGGQWLAEFRDPDSNWIGLISNQR